MTREHSSPTDQTGKRAILAAYSVAYRDPAAPGQRGRARGLIVACRRSVAAARAMSPPRRSVWELVKEE